MHIEIMKNGGASHLFESSWKRPYSTRGIRKILMQYTKAAGMNRSISPHKLRHFLFTWMKKQGVDASLVQKIDNSETGFSFLLAGPGGEHICFSNRAANNQLSIGNHELRILENTEWVYLTSLSGEWRANLDNIFSLSKSKPFDVCISISNLCLTN